MILLSYPDKKFKFVFCSFFKQLLFHSLELYFPFLGTLNASLYLAFHSYFARAEVPSLVPILEINITIYKYIIWLLVFNFVTEFDSMFSGWQVHFWEKPVKHFSRFGYNL